MKALDLGAYGIIVPLVNNAEEAAQAVAACRYPPTGFRSSGPSNKPVGGANYFTEAGDEIVVMAMIETKEGIANLDEICATRASMPSISARLTYRLPGFAAAAR